MLRIRMLGLSIAAAALVGCAAEGTSQPGAGEHPGRAAAGGSSTSSGTSTLEGSPLIADQSDVLLTCGTGPDFRASAMPDGPDELAGDADITAALEQLVNEAGIDAPLELKQAGVSDAEWTVLGRQTDDGTEEILLGMGQWDQVRGPVDDDDQYVVLERTKIGWSASGWGGCNLAPALADDLSWVDVMAPPDGLERSATAVEVEVNEIECASGRDPRPFLREPVVTEESATVTVYWTSEAPTGLTQTCQGTAPVPAVIELNRPLGSRALLDGSTWPPRPVGRS